MINYRLFVKILIKVLFIFWTEKLESECCGAVTHIEISYRALNNYQDIYGNINYGDIVRQNQDALEAGSVFPDTFYPGICYNGIFHDVSEDTHWIPFINASINYFRNNYQKPWDQKTEKLIAFIMGIMSHQVADVSWHALGIDQGFLQAMAGINYHGNFSQAHSVGDIGGDVLNLYQLDLSYSEIWGDWYVPSADVLNIFREYYGKEVINQTVLTTCSKLMYLTKILEKLFVKKYFPISAKKSQFLVDELYDYFLGGINDMSTWTQRLWRHLTYAFENGLKTCNMNHNSLFFRCNHTNNSSKLLKSKRNFFPKFWHYNKLLKEVHLSVDDVQVKHLEGALVLKPSYKLLEKVNSVFYKENIPMKPKRIPSVNEDLPKSVYTIKTDYAELGKAYAAADLNGDGNEDVVIGCPGYIDTRSGQKTGAIFILFGSDDGLYNSSSDILSIADVKILGPQSDDTTENSKFGSSIAIFDLDADGNLDIAVSAPSFGSTNLTYNGRVYVYTPLNEKTYILKATVDCQDIYCTLGTDMKAEDINGDGYKDLIISSPHAPAGGIQKGLVFIVLADNKYIGRSEIKLSSTIDLMGLENYGWFGYSLASKAYQETNETLVIVGSPGIRKCAKSDCSFDPADVQAIGQINVYYMANNKIIPGPVINGVQPFQMFGYQIDIGRLLDNSTSTMAVAASGQDVTGNSTLGASEIAQAGAVYIYNLTDLQKPISVFYGDRKFDRFGASLMITDVNKDGIDDLIIGAPLRTQDVTEEIEGAQQGRVYVWLGGDALNKRNTNCGTNDLSPCLKATRELSFGEDLARFGSKITIVKCKRKTNLLVTAEHSSKGGRLSGAIGVFDL